jgi:hypothetical protein
MARQVNAGLGSVFSKARASSAWRLDNNTGTNDVRRVSTTRQRNLLASTFQPRSLKKIP